MGETATRQRDWFAPVMTLATVVVAVWSLYFSGVQADVARKTFEMTWNEAHAGLQKDIADVQKQLATTATDRNLADNLARVADLQAKLAEQQRHASTSGGNLLADVQQRLADLQTSLAHLKKEQDQKDQEIAALRASLAAASRPRLTSPFLSGTESVPFAGLGNDSFVPGSKLHLPGTNLLPLPAPQVLDASDGKQSLFDNIWSLFRKYPGPSIYFALAVVMALSKLFGRN
jgi:uncharacterized membrane-anchored protein YhcB (DUF1043 family)